MPQPTTAASGTTTDSVLPMLTGAQRMFLSAVAVFPDVFDIESAAAIAGLSFPAAAAIVDALVEGEAACRRGSGAERGLVALRPEIRAHFSARPFNTRAREQALDSHVRYFLLEASGQQQQPTRYDPDYAEFKRANIELAAARHVQQLVRGLQPREADPGPVLTPRQWQIARLVADGCTNDQIARRLGIARWTAINHLRSIMRRLDCASRVGVARFVLSADQAAARGHRGDE